ncbi:MULTISPECIES: general stress protein [Thalassobacillus]|uniref:general stress protein n=1 Tax=Thalassobacillus TaxID=331971 RepID=UPI000A1C90B7|nr:general stress protein [Thalassobacillus devorans]
MQPNYQIFGDDEKMGESIDRIKKHGVDEDNIYILSHDNDHVRRAKRQTDANKIGVSETGLGTATKNVFRGKDDKLLSKMKEIGFEQSTAKELHKELEKGKTLLVVTNEEDVKF